MLIMKTKMVSFKFPKVSTFRQFDGYMSKCDIDIIATHKMSDACHVLAFSKMLQTETYSVIMQFITLTIGGPETHVFILVALARVIASHWFNHRQSKIWTGNAGQNYATSVIRFILNPVTSL